LIACLLLAGCETLHAVGKRAFGKPQAVGSYSSPQLGNDESAKVARNMVAFLSSQFPYAQTTIRLDPIKTSFHESLVHALAQQGFGVTENAGVADAVPLHYAVTLLDSGVIVRMRFQGKEATRFCSKTTTGLGFYSAYALRGTK